MIPQKDYKSRYFDGKSAIPEEGIAVFQNTNIHFTSNNSLTHKIPIQNFSNFDFVPHGCKLTLNPDEIYESPVLEIFCTKKESVNIQKIWFQYKKTEGVFTKIVYSIKEMNPFLAATIAGFLFIVFASGYYFGLLNLYRLFPTSFDQQLGSHIHNRVESKLKVCKAKEADAFFAKAIKTIRPKDSPYTYLVDIISQPDPNAFAVSGGRIYFFSGLLNKADSQEEVLGVLAHEIAHVEKRHHVRNLIKAMGTAFAISILIGPGLGDFEMIETISEIGTTILVLKFSRDFESEADEYSFQLLKDANLSLIGLHQFFEKLHKEESSVAKKSSDAKDKKSNEEKKSSIASRFFDMTNFLSTHPGTEERILALKKLIGSEKNKKKYRKLISDSEWKKVKNSCLVETKKNSD